MRFPRFMLISIVLVCFALCGAMYAQNGEVTTPIFSMSGVKGVAKSPVGDIFAILHVEGQLELWDAETQQTILQLETVSPQIYGTPRWSPDGKFVAAGTDSGAHVWDTATGALLYTLKGHPIELVSEVFKDSTYQYRADYIAFSPDGRFVLTTNTYDQHAIIWDIATGDYVTLLAGGFDDGVHYLYFSHYGDTLIVVSWVSVTLWDTDTWELLHRIEGHMEAIALSPDGSLLATGFGRFTSHINLWSVETGAQVASFEAPLYVSSLAWTADGETILASLNSGLLVSDDFIYTGAAVRGWNINNGRQDYTFELTSDEEIYYPFSADEVLIGVGVAHAAHLVLIWNTRTDDVYNAELALHEPPERVAVTSAEMCSFRLNADETLLATGTDTGLIIIWDFETGEMLETLQVGRPSSGGFAWLSNGQQISTFDAINGIFAIWELSSELGQ